MNNRYNDIMDNIKVDAEMHDRIIENIRNTDLNKQKRRSPFTAYRRYLSVAACLVILIVGAFVIYSISANQNPPVQVTNGIVECASLDELSKTIGFKVRGVESCPFEVKQAQYSAMWGTMAQIIYTGDNNSLTFRMSAGSEDNSGNYNDYSDVKQCRSGDYNVTLKGDNGNYSLAVWESGGYSYSITVTTGVSEEEMLKAVMSVK